MSFALTFSNSYSKLAALSNLNPTSMPKYLMPWPFKTNFTSYLLPQCRWWGVLDAQMPMYVAQLVLALVFLQKMSIVKLSRFQLLIHNLRKNLVLLWMIGFTPYSIGQSENFNPETRISKHVFKCINYLNEQIRREWITLFDWYG